MKSNVRINKIDHILISHLHGDHFFGLVGLLSTMHLFGRTQALSLYCPSPLRDIIDLQFKISDTRLNFEIDYHFTDKTDQALLFENKDLTVTQFPLDHSIFCMGFLFREKAGKYKIIKEKIPKGMPVGDILKLKEGLDIIDENGKIIYKNADYTHPPRPPLSYAFCSDTKYNESIIENIRGVSLLYHEATFGNDMAERALDTFHSTAEQAARIAEKAGAGKLLIGHYSVRYRELEVLLNEARNIFPDTWLAIEGDTFDLELTPEPH